MSTPEIHVGLGGHVRGKAWTGDFIVTTPNDDEWAALIDVVANPQVLVGPSPDYIASQTPKTKRNK